MSSWIENHLRQIREEERQKQAKQEQIIQEREDQRKLEQAELAEKQKQQQAKESKERRVIEGQLQAIMQQSNVLGLVGGIRKELMPDAWITEEKEINPDRDSKLTVQLVKPSERRVKHKASDQYFPASDFFPGGTTHTPAWDEIIRDFRVLKAGVWYKKREEEFFLWCWGYQRRKSYHLNNMFLGLPLGGITELNPKAKKIKRIPALTPNEDLTYARMIGKPPDISFFKVADQNGFQRRLVELAAKGTIL